MLYDRNLQLWAISQLFLRLRRNWQLVAQSDILDLIPKGFNLPLASTILINR